MKRTLSMMAMAAMFSLTANAQYEGQAMDDIIAAEAGQERVSEVRGWISIFQQAYADQQWDDAYENWKNILKTSPACNLGVYAKGAGMLSQMIGKETDAAKKETLFNDLMWLYDVRLKNLAALNSWQKKDRNKSTEGDVKVLKAYYYAYYAPTCVKDYTLNKAYDMFSEGIESVRTKGGKDVPYYALDMYIRVSQALYKANPTKYREQFLQDYLSCREVCEQMLEAAKVESDPKKAQKIVAQYDPVLQTCDGLFAESGAGDKEQLVAIFSPKVEQNKTNIDYLKKALTLMAANDCDDTDCYYKAAEYAFAIEPTYESAIGTAQKLSIAGKHAEAAQRYDKAIELCDNDRTKANICLKVAKAMTSTKNFKEAFAYMEKAATFNPELAGRVAFSRAQTLTKQEKYDEAVAACDEAIAADITLQGPATRLKEQISRVRAQIAEYNKKKAEYDAARAKQKAEEDFWNKGKN